MKSLAKISEASINKLLNTHAKNGYCIISARRSENSKAENDRLDRSLTADVQAAEYSYTPIYGGYKETTAGKQLMSLKNLSSSTISRKTAKPMIFSH